MGLPLFITPVEPEVAAKSGEKAASGPRSSIRRQRTVRGPPSRPSAEIRRRRMLSMVVDAEPEEYEISESRQGPLATLAEAENLQRQSMSWFEQERMRLRDTLSFERQHMPSNEIDGPFMPPVPESRDYASPEERQREMQRVRAIRQDLRRLARRRPAPTPPYTETDRNNYMVRSGPAISSPRPSSLTPARSPSHQPSTGEADASPRRQLEDSDFSFTVRGPAFADRAARSSLSGRIQALNRASNNNRRIIRQARLDGLGDRDRSLSPENGAAWDTLLTSITPDPQPPSAGSSFASASAAAAASSSASASGPTSASTSMTSIDGAGDSPTLHDCDVSESGSNTGDEEEDLYELQDFNRTRGERFWRTYADVVTSRVDRAARNVYGSDPERLGGMHRIISRLAERDEIPDDWWASAGLSRNIRREPST